MRKALPFVLLALVPAPAFAQSMPVSEFVTRATALEQKGVRAIFSRDLGVLKAEIQNSGKQLRAEREAALAAGRKPAFCPPKKAEIDPRELLGYFRKIPQRAMPVKQAFAGFMRQKFPCPA